MNPSINASLGFDYEANAYKFTLQIDKYMFDEAVQKLQVGRFSVEHTEVLLLQLYEIVTSIKLNNEVSPVRVKIIPPSPPHLPLAKDSTP
jgi:hypothetical protein